MFGWVVFIAGLWLCCAQASALTAETMAIDTGPTAGQSRALSPVWRMKCPAEARLVGLRLHRDDRIAGVEAICARLKVTPDGLRWASAPRLLPPLPEPEPAPVEIVTPEAEGTVLTASSQGVVRRRTSRALIITIERAPEPAAAETTGQPDRVEFRQTRSSSDLMCEPGRFVSGIRIGSQMRRRSDRLVALQILCSDGTAAARALVGDWPASPDPAPRPARRKGKTKAAASAPILSIQRIECRRAGANPHDGEAAAMIFGTIDDGRITTLGLSCARNLDEAPSTSRVYARLREWAVEAGQALAWPRRFDTPTWFDGSPVGVCEDGSGRPACIQASADRYCTEVGGYGRALTYDVGFFAETAVFASGNHCPRRACRSFAAITCGS